MTDKLKNALLPPSSYAENNISVSIYNAVKKYDPEIVVEFGVLCGYSTICIASALSERGHVFAYDLWENFKEYRNKDEGKRFLTSSLEATQKNIERFGVSGKVTLDTMDFYEWLKNPAPFNLLYLDIENTGETIRSAVNSLRPYIESGSVLMFEGGTEERDAVEWMRKNNKEPMFPLKDIIGYEVIDYNFPGLSIITKETLKHG